MNHIKQLRLVTVIAACVAITGCVSTKTVSKEQINDVGLSCASIATRIGEVQAARNYAKSNQGLSGSNVAAALFFWPALLVNNSNTSNMIKSMDERESVLIGYYKTNNCTDAVPTYSNKEIKKKIKSSDTLEAFS